ncbi:uncharacterized protein LOC113669686 [Pocillopora damicornis]|uniref:uncharacterized protein LOC113669686 n=1 Tax=Pocillopora damicornis TaxID=46731 RepID=UPI000F54DAFB|nr:uncharacterized protein LOC113669686 [Pocillopora damicornis]
MKVITAERQWPTDPYKESNVDFIVHLGRFNKTAHTPKEILRVNFRILKTFVAAMKYLMKQLKRLQGAEGLVTNELRSMKNHTKALINHLQKIVKIIQGRGNNNTPQGTQQRNGTVNKPWNRPPATQTSQDVLLHIKLMLDEFYGQVETLITDLKEIKGITCN